MNNSVTTIVYYPPIRNLRHPANSWGSNEPIRCTQHSHAIRSVSDVRKALCRSPFVPADADYELFIRKGDEWMHENHAADAAAVGREVVTVRLVFVGRVRRVGETDVYEHEPPPPWWRRLLFCS